MKKVGVAGIYHETHGFTKSLTDESEFIRKEGKDIFSVYQGTEDCIAGFIDGAADQFELLPIIDLHAMPSGNVRDEAYQSLKKTFVEKIKAAMPLDGLLINFHGAMRSESVGDCEGDILMELRKFMKDIPIVTTLDLHANIGTDMVANADAMIVYRNNPHTDKYNRGVEAATIMSGILSEKMVSCCHIKLPLLLSPLTTWSAGYPLKAGGEIAEKIRKIPGIINVGIAGGYCYSDCEAIGVSILVYYDATKLSEKEANDACHKVASAIWDMRGSARFYGFDSAQAVSRAMMEPEGPVILADVGDNIGGGSPGDENGMLKHLVENDVDKAVIIITDPESVDKAYKTGLGNSAEFSIGGKTEDAETSPIALTCVVENLTNGEYTIDTGSHFGSVDGNKIKMGRCAVVRYHGIIIILNEKKTPPSGPMQMRSQGVNPEEMKVIVTKSAIAFRSGFGSLPKSIIEVNTEGVCTCDISKLPIEKCADLYYPINKDIEWK